MRPQQRPRLNPFVLPSATATQFVLLVTALVGGSLFIYNYVLVLVPSRYSRAVDDCFADATRRIAERVDGHAIVTSYDACWRGISTTNSLLVLAGFAGLLLVAGLLYLLHPVAYRVLHRLAPPDAVTGPDLSERVRVLAAEAGLTRPPRILVRPVWAVDAYSFGLRRKTVVLNRGLLRKPAVLDAYLRHELGHLRNGDIGLTQFVLAAWRAFVLAAIVPFLIVQAAQPSTFTVRVLVNMGIVLAAIYLGTLTVLRLREHYADVRATVADGPQGALGSLMAQARGGSGWRDRLRWRRRRHPTAADRRAVVAEPGRLLRLGVLPMLVAGLSLGIGARSFPQLLTDLWIGVSADVSGLITAAFRLAVGILVAGAVGTACWRAAVASIVDRTRLPSAIAPGSALAAGILAGTSINDLQTGTWWGQVTTSPALGVVSALVLLVICVFFLQWSTVSGALWLEVTPTGGWRRRAFWAIPLSGVVGGLLFGAWFEILVKGPLIGVASLLIDLANGQLALAALAALGWPLAAGLRRRHTQSAGTHLDGSPAGPSRAPSAWPVRPLVPLAAGSVAAVVFAAPLLLVRDQVTEAIRGDTFGGSLAGIGIVLAIAAGLQATAAVVTAAVTGVRQATLGAAHGLAAATVAAIGMAALVTVVLLGPECVDEPSSCAARLAAPGWHQNWLILLIGAAALAATPLIWVTAWLARGLAELHGVPGWPRPPQPVHPRFGPRRQPRGDGPALPEGVRVAVGVAAATVFALVALAVAFPQPGGDSEPGTGTGTATIAAPVDRSLDGICAWFAQATLSAMANGSAANSLGPDTDAIGTIVAGSADPLMELIGEEIRAASAAGDTDRYLVAVSALGYRCIQNSAAVSTWSLSAASSNGRDVLEDVAGGARSHRPHDVGVGVVGGQHQHPRGIGTPHTIATA